MASDQRLTGGGTDGNERLTAATGVVLLVLLAVLGVTILRIGQLLWLHLFVGMLLIGPVLLKLTSTGYRFARYYTANPAYRRKGPPAAPMRLLAPLVVISTVVVFGSGVALLLAGPGSRSTLFPIHKLSFFAWLALTGLHVLGHLADLPAPLRADYGGQCRQLDPGAGEGRARAVARRDARRRTGPGRARDSRVRTLGERVSRFSPPLSNAPAKHVLSVEGPSPGNRG